MRKKWMKPVSMLLVTTMILGSAAGVSATTTDDTVADDEIVSDANAHTDEGTAVDATTAANPEETAIVENTATTDGTTDADVTTADDTTDNDTTENTDDSTQTSTETESKDISGTVTVEEGNTDVSGTVTVEEDKHDDNVKIKKNDKPYLALGANLSAEQQATVLALMGIDASQLANYDVVYVNNAEEHQYLDSYIDSSKIGTKSLSSVVIVERKDGNGINISTNNISYCTVGMYKNALATAGIENADIIVAAPFPISGTAALVGIFKAYTEMTGDEIDEENIDAALHELVVTGALEDSTGVDADEIEGMIAYVKQAVVEHDMTDEAEIREAIAEGCEKFDVTLTEDEINEIVQLMLKISDLDLDLDSLLNSAQSIYDMIGSDSGFWAKIGEMFSSLLEKLKSLFS